MNNPTIFADSVANVLSDTEVRVLHRVLGALKNLGGEAQTLGSSSGVKTNSATIASNQARKSITIQNLSGSALYVKLGSGASATDFHAALASEAGVGTGGSLSLNGYVGDFSFSPTTNSFAVLELE